MEHDQRTKKRELALLVEDLQSIGSRTISPGLAPFVQYLEAIQPAPYISLPHVAELAEALGVRTPARALAQRLVEQGWFEPSGLRGVYEFLPAASLGISPRRHDGPLLAALASDPTFIGFSGGNSSAYLHGFADRCPSRLHVAVPHDCRIPSGLRRIATVHRYTPSLPAEPRRDGGAPTLAVESLLVSLAESPGSHDWNAPGEWLPQAALESDPQLFELELSDRPDQVRVRLGYLLQNVMPGYAAELHRFVQHRSWFGPRGRTVHRFSDDWQLHDTCLPWDPARLVQGEAPATTW